MKQNKKGISAIVATVLIILITVAAVTIIWAAIIPMINNQLSKGTICLDAVSQVSLSDVGYTCINRTSGVISLQVRRGAVDFDLQDVQAIVSAGGDSISYALGVVDPTFVFPNANEEKVFLLDVSADFADLNAINKVEIAPIVGVGNAQETCDISASRVIDDCA